jgi:hypothetical protein
MGTSLYQRDRPFICCLTVLRELRVADACCIVNCCSFLAVEVMWNIR